ncbi:hypothetical protein Agub_g12237 [Astrephomene gubernaculifera]|uniref:Uncharacterized protein n=1 Tax=Astrephomene gubernaculifera TaxID=47775 RepID=A0AAD3HRF4_9CHLO|nr:hypothetical protein Agub_g12237 [Astrephomene gubernaculifera]
MARFTLKKFLPSGKATMSPLGVRCLQKHVDIAVPQTIFDVALASDKMTGPNVPLQRLFRFTAGTARCRVGPELSKKYNMQSDNTQLVVSVTNQATLEQAWFNAARTLKPQTFSPGSSGAMADPTEGGRNCDFCNWRQLTAEDEWGRLERPHAVSGSNLFKYGAPAHGLVLFKHHDPLTFSSHQLADFLGVAEDWFAAAAAAHPDAHHPFFIWNCGPRAGASQFHGHGQLMLTHSPVPAQARLAQQAALYGASHPGGASYFRDLVLSHAAVGLARVVALGPRGEDRCWLLAHLAPQKDMEVLLLASRLSSPAFVAGLHAALRALIDELGVQTFNAGVINLPLDGDGGQGQGRQQEVGVEHVEADGVGAAVGQGFRAAAGSNGVLGRAGESCGFEFGEDLGLPAWVEDGDMAWRPMLARVVSRGKVTAPASDYGCLEVVGHASIGHTDPFVLMRAIDKRLEAAGLRR